jgi:hypothetical protein
MLATNFNQRFGICTRGIGGSRGCRHFFLYPLGSMHSDSRLQVIKADAHLEGAVHRECLKNSLNWGLASFCLRSARRLL